jgi:uncharacterized protein (DUF58 family)
LVPTWLTITLLAAASAVALVAGGDGSWWWVLVAFDAAVALLFLLDVRLLTGSRPVGGVRRNERVMSVGERNRVVLTLTNETSRRLVVRVTEPLVNGLEPLTVDLGRVALPARGEATFTYEVRPLVRGRMTLPPTSVRVRGPLGLGWRTVEAGAPHEIRIYPNVMAVGRYQSLIRRSRLREMGIASVRQRGQGTEFESLREYIPGDDPVKIDWKATARRGKHISRNYQAERSQSIMLCLDAGRMMTTEIDGLSRFDHAVNSALLLAHVALSHGDGVGLVVFSGGVERYLPPRKGHGYLPRIVEALYDVQPSLVEPSYRDGVMRAAMGRRRSLVVLFTDVSGEEAASELVPYVGRLLPRHLPLVVFLRDREVEDAAEGGADPWSMAAAANFLEEREHVQEYLRSRGTMVLDVMPGQLAPRVVNTYLEIKARSLI